jgi:hypothetical protein
MTSNEGREIARELSRFPKKLRVKMRDAILRLVVAYKQEDDGAAEAEQLSLGLCERQREGNVVRPKVSAWERQAKTAARRRRAT